MNVVLLLERSARHLADRSTSDQKDPRC